MDRARDEYPQPRVQVGRDWLVPVQYIADDDHYTGYITLLPPKIARRKRAADIVAYLDAEGWAKIKADSTGLDVDPAFL